MIMGIFTGDMDLIKDSFKAMLKSFEDAVMKIIGSIGDALGVSLMVLVIYLVLKTYLLYVSEIFTNFITFAKEKLLHLVWC